MVVVVLVRPFTDEGHWRVKKERSGEGFKRLWMGGLKGLLIVVT